MRYATIKCVCYRLESSVRFSGHSTRFHIARAKHSLPLPCKLHCTKMSQTNFQEIEIYDNGASDLDILRTVINAQDNEDPLYILDIGDVVQRHKDWIKSMPRITPHFAIKCNPDPTVIKVLAALNAGFDCASEGEIRLVMQYGVPGDHIIFANPTKNPSHIRYARKVGVSKMTADSEIELLKIKEVYPEAEIVLRIRCDALESGIQLGTKFGCDPGEEAHGLIQLTKSLGLTLHGFSFHVGSPCMELPAYVRGINICKELIEYAKSVGCKDVQMIDIGGGFPDEKDFVIDELATMLNEAIRDIDPSIKIISEPGRYYVSSAFTLAAYLHTKKIVQKGDEMHRMYYVTCGTYGSFIEELLDLKSRLPVPLFNKLKDEKFSSTIWGPTCDSYDCIIKQASLPEYHVGDWLVWGNMGAYGLSLACVFNGFPLPKVYPVIRKKAWQAFCNELNSAKNKLPEATKCKMMANNVDRVELVHLRVQGNI